MEEESFLRLQNYFLSRLTLKKFIRIIKRNNPNENNLDEILKMCHLKENRGEYIRNLNLNVDLYDKVFTDNLLITDLDKCVQYAKCYINKNISPYKFTTKREYLKTIKKYNINIVDCFYNLMFEIVKIETCKNIINDMEDIEELKNKLLEIYRNNSPDHQTDYVINGIKEMTKYSILNKKYLSLLCRLNYYGFINYVYQLKELQEWLINEPSYLLK